MWCKSATVVFIVEIITTAFIYSTAQVVWDGIEISVSCDVYHEQCMVNAYTPETCTTIRNTIKIDEDTEPTVGRHIQHFPEADCYFSMSWTTSNALDQCNMLSIAFHTICDDWNNHTWCRIIQQNFNRSYGIISTCSNVKILLTFRGYQEDEFQNDTDEHDSSEEVLPNLTNFPKGFTYVCLEDHTNQVLRWCITPVGRTVFPCGKYQCLDSKNNFITRRCEFVGGVPKWSSVPECTNTTFSDSTTLFSKVRFNITPSALNSVANVIQTDAYSLSVLDVDIIADILDRTIEEPTRTEFKDSFFQIVNNVLDVNKTVLRSTREFGSTDKILKSVDKFLVHLSGETTSAGISLSNIAFEITKPSISNVDTHFNHTFEEVLLRIPNDILSTAVITVFKNSHLFPEGNVSSHIADLKLLGVNGTLQNPVSIFLQTDSLIEVVCSYWEFNQSGIGNWSTVGVETIRINDNLVECRSTHLTAFALIGISDRIIGNLSDANQLALQIITTILCTISFIGLLLVFITCFSLKSWYKKRINTIQLSGIIALEVFMLFLNDIVTISEGLGCMFYGIVMHYLVLVKFILMLLIAKMQYENFVTVLTSRHKSRKILLSATISYSIPIVIVGVSAGVFPQNYNPGSVNFCYPKEYAFKYFVIIPITLILLANILVFSMVMFKISNSISRDTKQKILQAKLAVMLFFMLGLTWIFSMCSHVVYTLWLQLVFVYIFCILSPLQGFVIFIFAVIMDADAKAFWMKCYNNVRYGPLDKESSTNITSTTVLMSSVSQSNTNTSEHSQVDTRLRPEDS